MRIYDSLPVYKPADMDLWDWHDMIDEMRGDTLSGEHIESGRDEDGNEYYRRYHLEEEGEYE